MNKDKFLELMSKAYDEKADIRLHFVYLKKYIDVGVLNEIQKLSIEAGGNIIRNHSSEEFNCIEFSNDDSNFCVSISTEIEQTMKIV
ncbi:hypothetical protein HF072_12860 [Bacillus sp. RO3]|nr:hypothetical protein [Bacillus sp. RO3]